MNSHAAPLIRRSFDELLKCYPQADVIGVDWGFPDSEVSEIENPWVLVTLSDHDANDCNFAIWKTTGAVYRMNEGAVEDDPFIEAS